MVMPKGKADRVRTLILKSEENPIIDQFRQESLMARTNVLRLEDEEEEDERLDD